MPKRNWEAIARLLDQHTRIAVSLASDPEILACYMRGFPHLFEEGENEGPLCIPLSVLMKASEDQSKEDCPDGSEWWEYDGNFSLQYAGREHPHLCIPLSFRWNDDEGGTLPQHILKQLIGQKAQAGLLITYLGKQCVVISIDFIDFYDNYEIGEIFTQEPDVYGISLVDAAFIALDK